jgi:pyruvate/2-oxoglutarate dehydrogenase complex dihydrolipoamide acyltransferase (E2) component
MPSEKEHKVRSFSPTRRILSDYYHIAANMHRIQGLLEMDVTKAEKRIAEIKEKENYQVSHTGWVAACIAKAVSEDKRFNSFRKGRRKIIVFDDIDISMMIEIKTKDGKRVPFNYVIRKAEDKSVKEITDGIRAIQKKKIEESEQLTRESSSFTSLYMLVPKFLRRLVIKILLSNPFYIKKTIGTVGMTSLGEYVKELTGYAIPFGDKTLNVAIGGMKETVRVIDGKTQNTKILYLTFKVNHEIVDGAPMARFITRVAELMKNAHGLDDITKI